MKRITRTGLVAMSLTLLSGTDVGTPDFGIDNDAEYQQLMNVIKQLSMFARTVSVSNLTTHACTTRWLV